MAMSPRKRAKVSRGIQYAVLLVLVLVFAFVIIGRRSHEEEFNLAGIWETA